MESFAIPGAGGIIEKNIDGIDYILVQERCKDGAQTESGLIEIPAGKVREYENIFDCLRREVKEETGLDITEIEGESESRMYECDGYKVLNYIPFNCSQNIGGYYPIMVEVFICRVEGELLESTNETKNIRWMPLNELNSVMNNNEGRFYPMHVCTLKKYLKKRGYKA
jgi:8-oxo-dGTP pyrophosphatase MutT (NUDIX family)